MPHPYPKNDRDSFEELHVVVEQLELCQGLLRSRSHSKARAAVILLDHVADVLMYRVCNDDFERQAFLEMIIPSAVPAKKRAEILFRFDAKVSYLSQKKGLMSGESASVLLISHRVRNFAYHRDYYNPHTISVVGRILYKTVCEILPILAQEGQLSYSSNAKEQAWTKRYGVAATLFNFPKALQHISDYLGQRIKITLPARPGPYKQTSSRVTSACGGPWTTGSASRRIKLSMTCSSTMNSLTFTRKSWRSSVSR